VRSRLATGRYRWAAVSCLIAAGFTGCGWSGGADPTAGNSGMSAQADLAPLTVAQVRALPERDPVSAIVRLWFWVQWGSASHVTAAYDPAVVRLVGARRLTSRFVTQRPNFLGFRPHVVSRVERGDRASVGVAGQGHRVGPYIGFNLRRVGARWLITHDTFLWNNVNVVARLAAQAPIRTTARSPRSAITRFARWVQVGSIPRIIGAYDPAAVRSLGAITIVRAYAGERQTFRLSHLGVVTRARRRDSAFVSLLGRGGGIAPFEIGFGLSRARGSWAITEDTLVHKP